MKKLLSIFLAALLICGACAVPALADGAASADSGGGYIVRLKDGGASALSADGDSGRGLIQVDSLSEVRRLEREGLVEYAEPNGTAHLIGTANDAYYARQWNLTDIGAGAAWDAGLTGGGVRVAVIDSGVYRAHEDLRGADILEGKSVISGITGTEDTQGHGTMVTGILAATRNNGIGIAGISDGITVVPIKCFAGSDQASVLDVATGIYAAVDDYACSVICLSLGAEEDSRTLKDSVDYAAGKGVIVVAAVGNDGKTAYYYPAAYDSVIGVGSYGAGDTASDFSESNDSVLVSAPGEDIVSTYIGRTDAYALGGGTSFSTPHVAAMAAIARSYDPNITAQEFRELLTSTCVDAGTAGYDPVYGYGRVSMTAFVAALLSRDKTQTVHFTDMDGHWAEQEVYTCVRAGLFDGVSDTRFDPEGTMTRGMLVTALYRYDAGAHAASDAGAVFSDVTDTAAWYYAAVRWAASNGIVDGFDDGTFRPEEPITREQLCAVLYRYSGNSDAQDGAVLNVFSDSGSISPYAVNAMTWCYKNGLVGGVGDSRLEPQGRATRAQAAAILARYSALSK